MPYALHKFKIEAKDIATGRPPPVDDPRVSCWLEFLSSVAMDKENPLIPFYLETTLKNGHFIFIARWEDKP